MARIPRVTQAIFAGSASNNGVFGSAQDGTKILSNTLSVIMEKAAWAQGWLSAVIGGSKFPPLEEFQSVEYVHSTQIAYILQQGIPEYDNGTTYYLDNIVIGAGSFQLFGSLTDSNVGNALPTAPASNTNWKFLCDLSALSTSSFGLNVETKTGSTFAPVAGDAGAFIQRSNSGSAMTDTFPGTSGALASGWASFIENVDASGSIAVGVGSGGTISVGSGYTANAFFIAPGETWLVVAKGTGNYTAMRVAAATLHTKPPQGARSKITGVWASNTTATWTAAGIVLYDASGNSKLAASFNQTLTSTTSGIGGFTSTIGAGWWGVYAALNPTTGAQGIFADASFTAPTVPTGYGYAALIGAVKVDGSNHFIGFTQADNLITFTVGNNLSNLPLVASGTIGSVTVPTYVAQSVRGSSSFVPPNASEILMVLSNSAGTGEIAIVAPNGSYGSYSSVTNPPYMTTGSPSAGSTAASAAFSMLLESNSVYYAANSTASTALFCAGFRMNL